MRHHPFEEAEVASLEYMPFDVRRKLDLVGLHVSLACWQSLSLQERGQWCDEEVMSPAQIASFAERVRRVARNPAPRVIEAVDPDLRPWDQTEAREAIAARASLLGIEIDESGWLELGEAARYALYRLSDARKSAEKFRAALHTFALTSG